MTADTTPESPDYTPTTEEVRIKYTLSSGRSAETPAEFDRWLAAHDEEVTRKALTDAADDMSRKMLYVNGPPTRTSRDFYVAWLRARAEQIGEK